MGGLYSLHLLVGPAIKRNARCALTEQKYFNFFNLNLQDTLHAVVPVLQDSGSDGIFGIVVGTPYFVSLSISVSLSVCLCL